MVTRLTATLITVATVVLFVGCGGGSSKHGTAASVQVGPSPIVAKDGEFRTVIPRGYANYPSVAQYWATRPQQNGLLASVLVVRQAVSQKIGISTFARSMVRAIRPITQSLSHLQPVSVDAEPGYAVEYVTTGTGTVQGKLSHVRQVLVKHGQWVFFIRDLALPAEYAATLGALDEVLRNWHWQ